MGDVLETSGGERLAHLSHELRTPLASMLGYADLLAAPGPLAHAGLSREKAVARIKEHGERLLATAEKLAELYLLDRGEVRPRWSRVAAASLLERALAANDAGARARGITLELGGGDAGTLVTDAELVVASLRTLVANAVRFSPPGAAVQASCTAAPDGAVHYAVRDEGRGIPVDRLPNLFEPALSREPLTGRSYGGSGLGLALAARRLRLVGGSLCVRSQPGAGSTFQVALPSAPGDWGER